MILDPTIRSAAVDGNSYDIVPNLESGMAKYLGNAKTWEYNGGQCIGKDAEDMMCLTFQTCRKMNFVYCQTTTGMDFGADGVLGVANPDFNMMVAPDKRLNEDSFLGGFNGTLDAKAFSTRMSNDAISWVDFGAPDSTQTNGNEISIGVNEDFFWSSALQGIQIGNSAKNSYGFAPSLEGDRGEFIGSSIYSIFDFNSPDIYLSTLWMTSFLETLMGAASVDNYEVRDGTVYCDCSSNFPDLFFNVEGFNLKVNVDDYLVDISAALDRTACKLRIRPIDAGFHVLGRPLYLGYYVTHNWEDVSMSFGNFNSDKDLVTEAPMPEKQFTVELATEDVENGELWALVASSAIVLVVLSISSWVLYDERVK